MQTMSKAAYQQFLSEGTRTGKLATVRADGRPHLVPVWFVLDGDDLIFMTGEKTVKAKNIAQQPLVSICVDDENPPFSFVIVEGEAQADPVSPEQLLAWSTQIGGRYMGSELAEKYGRRNATSDELLIRVKPTRVLARKNIAD